METEGELIEVIAIALSVAFVAGMAARTIRMPPIVGYLAAGAALGPHTPGYQADLETIQQMAELGVIFLMFGVGLKFNLRDLLAVRALVVPGAILQISATTAAATVVAMAFGFEWREAVVLGLAVSIASTVVLVRVLTDRGVIDTIHGRVAIGWLVVQDLATILALSILPGLAAGDSSEVAGETAVALAKALAFVAVVLIAGPRLMPFLMRFVAQTGVRELFVLAVVIVALGIAALGTVFEVSLALGAFVAGVAISEAETSHQAAAEVVPFREAFAVLFFVAVGMLIEPSLIGENAGLLVAVLALVLLLNGAIAVGAVGLSRYGWLTAATLGAGLGTVGEFSFVIATEGQSLDLVGEEAYNVVLGASVVSIAVNRLVFRGYRLFAFLGRSGAVFRWIDDRGGSPEPAVPASGHVVVAGLGRVGHLVMHSLAATGVPAIAIDANLDLVRRADPHSIPAIWGDSANSEVLSRANIEQARLLVVAVPDIGTAMLATANARKLNSDLAILVRAQHRDDLPELYALGVQDVVVPEYEGGLELMQLTLAALGFDRDESLAFAEAQRDVHYGAAEPGR